MVVPIVSDLTVCSLRNVLQSPELSDEQKVKFIRANQYEIKDVMRIELGSVVYNKIMEKRPLLILKPIKNSFTKRGDKAILAKVLNISEKQLDNYIKEVSESLKGTDLTNISSDRIESIKTYVYRHGSKDEVVKFLDYELAKSTNIIKSIQKNLVYHNGGMADYFIRPIHRMTDKTFVSIYKTISDNLSEAREQGKISEAEETKIAEWALSQLYQVQYNSRFINAIKKNK